MTHPERYSLDDVVDSLPESLRRTLALLGSRRGWTLVVRHAEREHFQHGTFGNDVSLTPHGRRQAFDLGKRLRGRLAGVTSSPLPRCTETARLVSAGAGQDAEPSTDRLLGDPGPFIEDADLASRAFHAMPLKELVNRFLNPDTTPEGMRPADAGCADLLALARAVLPRPGEVHLMITHDIILAPLLALIAGERNADHHWPDFLDGVALAWDGSVLLAVVGGELRKIGYANWREPEPFRPTTLWWLVTARCDLACHHCYLRGSSLPSGEMDTPAALDAVRQAAAAGIEKVHLTGGEPFLRSDLGTILDAIRAAGMIVTGVETNGGHLAPTVLACFRPQETIFFVSFDGAGVHDAIRGRTGSAEKVERAIRDLRRSGFRVVVQTTLTAKNVAAMTDTFKLLTDWCVQGWRLFPVAPIGKGRNPCLRLSADAEGLVYSRILDAWIAAGRPFDLWLGSLLTHRREGGDDPTRPPFVCNYAASTITLLPSGHVVPCCRYVASPDLMAGFHTLGERPLREQLHSSLLWRKKKRPFEKRLAASGNEACKDCSLLDACEMGCEVVAWHDHGDLKHHDSQHCRIMRTLYERVRCWDHPENGHA
ncbi:MAG: radical SAM protein [Deltaproteobacteria bacterium]|nr:MAG: radical SAM protein [Deltaproteobacteria bacterium]